MLDLFFLLDALSSYNASALQLMYLCKNNVTRKCTNSYYLDYLLGSV